MYWLEEQKAGQDRIKYMYWRKSYSKMSTLLPGWSNRFINSTIVITIWLTVPKYPYLKWEWIFYFLRRCFFPLSLPRLLWTLTVYMSYTADFASTGVHPRFFGRVHVAHRFSFLCCPIICIYVLRFRVVLSITISAW